MGALLDGKGYANRILAEVKAEVAARLAAGGSTPCLAVVLVGEDPASEVYVRGKVRACAETGIRSLEHKLPAATDQAALEALIDRLNADASVHGILVQLPLPKHLDTKAILYRVDPTKDVDGFHPMNQGLLFQGVKGLRSCTP
ncbi:MAG TPA: bifunctional 5,10-methylenetetrahydrofolate dehydrogenase/5,10-methenyltetrahydrofolate cyclohydrolase, partial [Holophagaceae bacterium]|nr:bifunctional 5,10-methylenetetrahydrofolate dehydrogenase/5,10-methenyltetrahydrofolate cyclohydrolase [Holophagaceae bacterium]